MTRGSRRNLARALVCLAALIGASLLLLALARLLGWLSRLQIGYLAS